MSELYPFDPEFIEVSFNAMPGADEPVIVAHKLRKPTVAQLLEREKGVQVTIRELTPREEHIEVTEEAANIALWNDIIVAVKGYRDKPEWTPLDDSEKQMMRAAHKVAAIRAMYTGAVSVVGGESEVSIGGDEWTIRQTIGPDPDSPRFTIDHILREPSESERAAFRKRASKVSFVRGSRRPQTRISVDLGAYIQLYDSLIIDVQGATVGGEPFFPEGARAAFIAAIDPTWKRQVVQKLMDAIEAALLD
jgi:hypothetical protein